MDIMLVDYSLILNVIQGIAGIIYIYTSLIAFKKFKDGKVQQSKVF